MSVKKGQQYSVNKNSIKFTVESIDDGSIGMKDENGNWIFLNEKIFNFIFKEYRGEL